MDKFKKYLLLTPREAVFIRDLLIKAANTSRDEHLTVMAERYVRKINQIINP